jgi:hypothetical protein
VGDGGWRCRKGGDGMRCDHRTAKSAVIARLGGAIQYVAEDVYMSRAGGYWMPAFAGMTEE